MEIESKEQILERRQEIERQRRRAEQAQHVAWVRQHMPKMLDMGTPHDRTSCRDEDHTNARRGCVRCAIFDLMDEGEFPYRRSFTLTPVDPDDT